MGLEVGVEAFTLADRFFAGDEGLVTDIPELPGEQGLVVYPNPVQQGQQLTIKGISQDQFSQLKMTDAKGRDIAVVQMRLQPNGIVQISTDELHPGLYYIHGASFSGVPLLVK